MVEKTADRATPGDREMTKIFPPIAAFCPDAGIGVAELVLGHWEFYCALDIKGEPKGQPRARVRHVQTKDGREFGQAYNPAGAWKGWKELIVIQARRFRPLSPFIGPIRVDYTALMPRPQRLCRKQDWPGLIPYDVKPDRDNLDKLILDALENTGFYRNDCQVSSGLIEKFYAGVNDIPGCMITISTWKNEFEPERSSTNV